MKAIYFSFFFLVAGVCSTAQNPNNIGVIVNIEEQITHNYIGVTIFNLIHNKKYESPFELEPSVTDTLLDYLNKRFPRKNFILIDRQTGIEYMKNQESLRSKDFKQYKLEWLNNLKAKYEVGSVIFLKNDDSSPDMITNSKYYLDGYGLYNSALKKHNYIYMPLELYYFEDHRNPKYYYGAKCILKDETLPRNIDPKYNFTQDELMVLEKGLKELIKPQLVKFFEDPEYPVFK